MNNAVSNIIEDACKKSHLYGQIKTLMNMQRIIKEKIIILEADLVKLECKSGK